MAEKVETQKQKEILAKENDESSGGNVASAQAVIEISTNKMIVGEKGVEEVVPNRDNSNQLT